jgi:hypothetical protein
VQHRRKTLREQRAEIVSIWDKSLESGIRRGAAADTGTGPPLGRWRAPGLKKRRGAPIEQARPDEARSARPRAIACFF